LTGGARGGVRPVRPKQALTVAGGRVVSSPLGSGVKSGIRPIEAMLGAGAQTPTTSATSSNLAVQVIKLNCQCHQMLLSEIHSVSALDRKILTL